jgi:predicted DNA binding protein
MEIGEGQAKAFTVLEFTFSHSNDWTKMTKPIRSSFLSLIGVQVGEDYNYECVLAKWEDRRRQLEDFFEREVRAGHIYEVERIVKLWTNLWLVSFLGPGERTVRRTVVGPRSVSWSSRISKGLQHWQVTLRDGDVEEILDKLNSFGRIRELNLRRVYLRSKPRGLWFNSTNPLKFILTERELEVLRVAHREGMFNKSRAVNKSTVDREIRAALSKVINLYMNLGDEDAEFNEAS